MAEPSASIVLRELRVRPVVEAAERAAYNRLMEAHHCLGFGSPFGATLRQAAGHRAGIGLPKNSERLALRHFFMQLFDFSVFFWKFGGPSDPYPGIGEPH